MKHNWKETQLSELLQLNVDSVDVNSQPEFHFAGVYCFGNGIFEKGYQNNDTSYKTFNRLHKNQIVVSKVKGWEGAIALVSEEFEGMFLSPVYPTFELISEEKASLKFIHYFLKQEHVWQQLLDKSVGIGARRNSVSEAQFLNLSINLPQLEIQNKIIDKIETVKAGLDELQNLRIEQEKEMNNLRYSLMCSLENEYSKKRIDDVCDLKKGSFPIMKTNTGEYPFVVTAAEFKTANNFDFDCEATCVPLVSSTGHGNAAMHRVHYASGKFALSNLLCAVMPKDKEIVNAKFLYELFMAKKDEYFVPIMAGTSNVSLNTGKLGAVEIPIPPIEEQKRIVALLEKINEIKQTHKEQEAELKQLMPSLLDKAFKGKLFGENSIQIQNEISLPTQQSEIKLPLAASDKNDDLEIAMIVALIESRLGNSYGEVGIQKTVFNIEAFDPVISRKYSFVNYHYGTFSAELKESIKVSPFLGKKVIKGNEVFTISPIQKKIVLDAISDKSNQGFVMAVNNVLDLYSSPFIGKHTDKIELLNTVTKLIIDLQTSDVNTIYEGMKKWTIKQQGFKNKADKFNITDTKKTIELLESNDLIENLVK